MRPRKKAVRMVTIGTPMVTASADVLLPPKGNGCRMTSAEPMRRRKSSLVPTRGMKWMRSARKGRCHRYAYHTHVSFVPVLRVAIKGYALCLPTTSGMVLRQRDKVRAVQSWRRPRRKSRCALGNCRSTAARTLSNEGCNLNTLCRQK